MTEGGKILHTDPCRTCVTHTLGLISMYFFKCAPRLPAVGSTGWARDCPVDQGQTGQCL